MWFWAWPWMWFDAFGTFGYRPAEPPDSARLSEIHAAGFAIGWDVHEIEALLSQNAVADCLVWRSALGERVCGFAISRVTLDESELLSIAIVPDARGRKLSAPFLDHHAGRVRRAGALAHILEVSVDNAPALALYRGLGYAEIGRRKSYYRATASSPRRDALILRRDLSPLDPTPRDLF